MGYHKCMSVYFNRVFEKISVNSSFEYQLLRKKEKDQLIPLASNPDADRIIMVNNVGDELKMLPAYFRGTHIIRDPRDLLVSGYRYHLWCSEPWILVPIRAEMKDYLQLAELSIPDPGDISYQDLIKSLDKPTGLLLELNRMKNLLSHMADWDYHHPNILELRYEKVFGNEENAFRQIFSHYRFNEEETSTGLSWVKHFSFDSQKKVGKAGDGGHLAKGIEGQWRDEFFPGLRKKFKDRYQQLLIKTGYEKDDSW